MNEHAGATVFCQNHMLRQLACCERGRANDYSTKTRLVAVSWFDMRSTVFWAWTMRVTIGSRFGREDLNELGSDWQRSLLRRAWLDDKASRAVALARDRSIANDLQRRLVETSAGADAGIAGLSRTADKCGSAADSNEFLDSVIPCWCPSGT